MGRPKPKLHGSIPVPHDGLLNHIMGSEAQQDIGWKDRSGVLDAWKVLQSPKETLDMPTKEFWQTVRSTSQIRDQLQALQAYRSKLLHSLRNNDGQKQQKTELRGTLRILLEWMLSFRTPQPLRRAIQSNLQTLESIIGDSSSLDIKADVVSSMFQPTVWAIPTFSLFEALNSDLFQPVFSRCVPRSSALNLITQSAQPLAPVLREYSFQRNAKDSLSAAEERLIAAVEKTVHLATTIKLLMAPILQQPQDHIADSERIEDLQSFLWIAIECTGLNANDLSKVGVAYGQTLLFRWRHLGDTSDTDIAEAANRRLKAILQDKGLAPLNTLAVVQGIAATLPNTVLVCRQPRPLLQDPIGDYLLHQCREAVDSATRLSALRGLNTLLNRCSSISDLSSSDFIQNLVHETLELVLHSWENPPGRQVASGIPGLFQSLLPLLRSASGSDGIQHLVARVLAQPLNRKGRYIALETLLPIVGAKSLIDAGGESLIRSLVEGIGDGGHTIGIIAELLGKLLSRLREEMNAEAGVQVSNTSLNRKQRRKLERESAKLGMRMELPEEQCTVSSAWVNVWAPHFAVALLDDSAVRRKQTSAFCLPLLVTMVGGPRNRLDASMTCVALLEELKTRYESMIGSGLEWDGGTSQYETLYDRFLWAKLEIVRQATADNLVQVSTAPEKFTNSLAQHISLADVQQSLIHSSRRIRLVGFAALESVILCHNRNETALRLKELQIPMWSDALPNAFKSDGKEYVFSLLQLLSSFLDTLSLVEAEHLESVEEGSSPLQVTSSFVSQFLLEKLLLCHAAYLGTVADKESFVLPLLQCILSFCLRHKPINCEGKPFVKVPSTQRRLRESERATMAYIQRKLVSTEVFATLFSLLHSMWDNTRHDAYQCLVALVQLARITNVDLPKPFGLSAHPYLEARAVYLASSPRQRESDTGAKMIAYLAATTSGGEFLEKLLSLLEQRVHIMKERLLSILSSSERSSIDDGIRLPLAHGLMESLRLIVSGWTSKSHGILGDTIDRMVAVCCESIKLTLSVVADVKDGETIAGLEETNTLQSKDRNVPLNVNTGAIGANGTFSSVDPRDEEDARKRVATQRVIIGSWLLTKEACAALSAVLTSVATTPSREQVEISGNLLISTMVSLKHQGAAFAAHKALQQIAALCNNRKSEQILRSIPVGWAKRLMSEMSATESVRDSTLRRSTGYALGCLSIMRSELPASVAPRTQCLFMLTTILRYSLPPKTKVLGLRKAKIFQDVQLTSLFAFPAKLEAAEWLLPDDEYEVSHDYLCCRQPMLNSLLQSRCRVHALNILRLIILDAPVAADVGPFVGDAIMSAILGYNDESWAVRNSSTMVFSAAMLRVVDADRNGVRRDSSAGNAITVVEFFRLYPSLAGFLVGALRHYEADEANASQSSKLLNPSVYPILLLLARLQPNKSLDSSRSIVNEFTEPVARCLLHGHHKVRLMAARALANLCGGHNDAELSDNDTFVRCFALLQERADWNSKHGALQAIAAIVQSYKGEPSASTLFDSLAPLRRASGKIPPPCTAALVAIEHTRLMHADSSRGDSREFFVRECFETLNRLGEGDVSIGVARLRAVVARTICEQISPCIWARDDDDSIGHLGFLLMSGSIDVRIESAKAFKKTARSGFQTLAGSSSVPMEKKVARIGQIVNVLRDATVHELHNHASPAFSLPPHEPTLRRLTRCLLDGLYCMMSLSLDVNSCLGGLWELANGLIDVGNTEIDHDSTIAGNAVELMGVAISGQINYQLHDRVQVFTSILKELNDPMASWRIRHSVAMAVKSSQLMTVSSQDIANEKQTLYWETLKLLQDSDPDVRFVATSIISSVSTTVSSSTTPAFALGACLATSSVSSKGSPEAMLGVVLETCNKALEEATAFQAEMAASERPTAESLLNLEASRKIFEDENPNPYEEVLVTNHLMVSSLARREKAGPPMCNMVHCSRILSLCKNLLQVVRVRTIESLQRTGQDHADLIHEMTRSSKVFPSLHTLLLASILVLYWGAQDTEGVKIEAKKLLEMSDPRTSQTIHPKIREAVEVLERSQGGESSTQDALLRCCFLA